ncbi:MAG: Sjogren's syndrome/scleroderma autoantigen 1 family protein [Archaeoglobaceae archaeon]
MSNKKISDEAIIDAAKLLRKGAKMLSYYCPECHFPLFETEGKVFCPNCEREVIIEKEVEKKEQKIEYKPAGVVGEIENAILRVCELIVNSSSAEEIKILSESLEKLVNAMEKLRRGQ